MLFFFFNLYQKRAKISFFTLRLWTWMGTERLGLDFSLVIKTSLSTTIFGSHFYLVAIFHCVHLAGSSFTRKRS